MFENQDIERGEKLRKFFAEKEMSQTEIAARLGISQSLVNRYFSGKPFGKKAAAKWEEEFGLSPNWLILGIGDMTRDYNLEGHNENELHIKEYGGFTPVRLVTSKARAGFSDCYYADEYHEEMPIIYIQTDKDHKGMYLSFEVDGDSMEPEYNQGDVVIGRMVPRNDWKKKLHINKWDFIIAHSRKGLMVKEIISHNVETGDIVCHSINSAGHPDFTLNLRDVTYLFNIVDHHIDRKNKPRRYSANSNKI